MADKREVDIDEIFRLGTPIIEAFEEAGRQAVIHHQMSGVPLVYWRDGKIIYVDPFTGEEVDRPKDAPKPIQKKKREVDICAMMRDGTTIKEAFEQAHQDAVLQHQKTRVPLVYWRDGKVVHVDPFTGEDVDPNDPEVIAKIRPIPYYLHAL